MVTGSAVVVVKLDDNHWRQSYHEWTHTSIHKDPFRCPDRSNHDVVASVSHTGHQDSNPPVCPYDIDRVHHDASCRRNHIGKGDCCDGRSGRANQGICRDDEIAVAVESLWWGGGAAVCGSVSSTKTWKRMKNAQWTGSVTWRELLTCQPGHSPLQGSPEKIQRVADLGVCHEFREYGAGGRWYKCRRSDPC
jgi:hypothetical protein